MAKTREVRDLVASTDQPKAELSTKVKNAIESIKKPFATFVRDYSALAASREELAPQFMKAFGLWQSEIGGTFVDFVRMLHPEIGKTREEYRAHRAYQAADYLRRIVGNVNRRPSEGEGEDRPAPASPTETTLVLLASILQLIPEQRQDEVFAALQERLHFTESRIETLKEQVQEVDPLVQIRGKVQGLRLSFPHPVEAQKTGTEG